MERDKRLHLIFGTLAMLILLGLIFLKPIIGTGPVLILGSFILGVGVEGYQRIRGEGSANWLDASYSMAPGIVVGVALWVLA